MIPPLTAFLIELQRTPLEKLRRADPAKLAAKYGISEHHAAGYLRMRREG